MIVYSLVAPVSFPMRQQSANTRISTTTIVEPTGVPARIEMMMPEKALMTDRNALQKAGLIEKVGADFLADSELVLTEQ